MDSQEQWMILREWIIQQILQLLLQWLGQMREFEMMMRRMHIDEAHYFNAFFFPLQQRSLESTLSQDAQVDW